MQACTRQLLFLLAPMLTFLSPCEKFPGGLTHAFDTLVEALESSPNNHSNIFVGVGWHTSSANSLLRLGKANILMLWSHGLGNFAFYTSKPLHSLLRIVIRLPQIITALRVLQRCTCLVVAYKRSSALDTRSIDQLYARLLNIPVCIIPNPIDIGFWMPSSSMSAKFNQPRPTVCLSVGRAEWQKGHQHALNVISMAQCSSALDILAPAHTDFADHLLKSASSLGIASRMTVSIGNTASQRRHKLQNATCLICMSDTEYQSLSILEALSCGCPVIALPRGWLRNRNIPGVLIAQSISHASSLLDHISADPNLRCRLGQAARQYVEQNHSLNTISQQWLKLESQLLNHEHN